MEYKIKKGCATSDASFYLNQKKINPQICDRECWLFLHRQNQGLYAY